MLQVPRKIPLKVSILCVSVYVNAYSCLLCTAPADFTEEEVRKFDRRLEEGFDLPDSRYDLWRSMNHRKST